MGSSWVNAIQLHVSVYAIKLFGVKLNHQLYLNLLVLNELGRFLNQSYTKLLFVTICGKSVIAVSFVIIVGTASILHVVHDKVFVICQL